MRHYYPVLMMQEQVVALPGVAVDESFRLDPDSRIVLAIAWRHPQAGDDPGDR